MNQTSNSANNSAGSRRWLWMLLYVAVVAGGVLAALQVRRFWLHRQQPASPPAEAHWTGASQTQPAWAATGPAEAIADPLAGTALQELQSDPAQIPPPAGAHLRWAFQRCALGRLEQYGRYDFAGTPDAVAEHYINDLARRGFKLLRDGSGASGRRELMFVQDRTAVNVVLRKRTRQEKIVVEFTVSVLRGET